MKYLLVVVSLISLLLAGCAAPQGPASEQTQHPLTQTAMSGIRMETGRGRVPLVGDMLGSGSYWIDTIDGKDRRRFQKDEAGFYMISAGKHEVGLGWAASYSSAFSFITFEVKPERLYRAYVNHVPKAVEFWITDGETGEIIGEKHTVGITRTR